MERVAGQLIPDSRRRRVISGPWPWAICDWWSRLLVYTAPGVQDIGGSLKPAQPLKLAAAEPPKSSTSSTSCIECC